MRKLKLQMQVSLDGFVAGPKGEMNWLVWNWDEELKEYVNDITDPVDCIVLGRKLAEGFIPVWSSRANNPEETTPFAHKMNDTPKVVFSKTMNSNEWERTSLVKDLVKGITKLKEQPGDDIIAYGGGNFVSNLIQHGLIDEYHFFVNPVALGDGMTIFKGIRQQLKLKLIESFSFPCGITVLYYHPAAAGKKRGT